MKKVKGRIKVIHCFGKPKNNLIYKKNRRHYLKVVSTIKHELDLEKEIKVKHSDAHLAKIVKYSDK